MTVYIAGRQTGKTIYLIWMSAKTGAVIVAPTYQMVSYIDQMARKLGLKIPPPISVVEWAQMGSPQASPLRAKIFSGRAANGIKPDECGGGNA